MIAGHKLSLGRDIRKEFNAAAQPVRTWSLKLKSPPHFPPAKPTDAEMDLFRQYLPTSKKKEFNSLLHQYDHICAKQRRTDAANSTYYDDLSELKAVGIALMTISGIK